MHDTTAQRWAAVQSRTVAVGDTTFVYAVVTTHIYCRPTCPSRLARRANVKFFDTAGDAAAASFRACKRCKPDEQTMVDRVAQLVDSAKLYIAQKAGHVTLGHLAIHLDISPRYLHHIFSKKVGCTPAAYAAIFKVDNNQCQRQQPKNLPLSDLDPCSISIPTPDSSLSTNAPTPIYSLDMNPTTQQSHSTLSTETYPSPWSDFDNFNTFPPSLLPLDSTSMSKPENGDISSTSLSWQNYDANLFDLDLEFDAALDAMLDPDLDSTLHDLWTNVNMNDNMDVDVNLVMHMNANSNNQDIML